MTPRPDGLPFVFQGNDQVRFELTCYALCPNIKVRHPKSSPGDPLLGSWLPPQLVRNSVLTPTKEAVRRFNKLPAAHRNVLAFEGAVMILNGPIFTPNTTRPQRKWYQGSCQIIDAACFSLASSTLLGSGV